MNTITTEAGKKKLEREIKEYAKEVMDKIDSLLKSNTTKLEDKIQLAKSENEIVNLYFSFKEIKESVTRLKEEHKRDNYKFLRNEQTKVDLTEYLDLQR